MRIAVNVSARQLDPRLDFAQVVAKALNESGLDPALLELEITEGVLLMDEARAIAALQELKDLGIRISLDDFGTGYSSLSYLRNLPIDTLKIDRSFVVGIEDRPDDAALLASIISMAKALRLHVIVEGVETEEQRSFLETHGCDEIQGYLFCKPVCGDEAGDVLRWSQSTADSGQP